MFRSSWRRTPVFWGFLSPRKILHKPAVLTKKQADFGILTTTKILYLIEIEKPTTRLLTKTGRISADIQKGADQIRDWDQVVTEHRGALLTELGLDPSTVHDIRYVLVGGLSTTLDSAGLRKLRREPFGPKIDFYCFDELAAFPRVLHLRADGKSE